MGSADVLEAPWPLLLKRGKPEHIKSNNGPEFVATGLQNWLVNVGVAPFSMFPCSLLENGHNKRFNPTPLPNARITAWFLSIDQANITWLGPYNRRRPHQALTISPPILETLGSGQNIYALDRQLGPASKRSDCENKSSGISRINEI
ncbi:MAG: hypothetical protein AAGH83_08670 [Pseudomonadota bacterium]